MPYPKKSAAAVLNEYKQPLEVREIDVPELEPDAMIVEVEASTMCGTDVHIHQGEYASAGLSKLPLVMGHEIVGRIAVLGKDRRTDALGRPLQEGDLVAWSYAWCGRCFWCTISKQPTACANARMYGWGSADQFPHLTGGFSEYAYVMPLCDVVKVPENLDPALAASSTCAFRTIVHGYEKIGKIETIDTVVIQGSGPVGLYALAFAIQSGARQTICIGAPASRLELAGRWGANHTFDIGETDVSERRERVLELTEGRGADLVVECSGAGAAFVEGMNLIRRGGRYLILGQADPNPVEISGTYFNLRQLTVAGTMSADISHYYRALQFLSDHQEKFPFHELLGNKYGLSGVNDALESMKAMREVKPVIIPSMQG
ncbi:zinc-binding dehydrogenase [Rubrobacter marinus]|uniref:Zinc-binding dehydrogenase n=1 Tax=Rubrobacter marinus TaxID=2653852 RepID=A0A6G8Q0L0_9ACTN|nr:zinc-binding dehydrogenase [Rubrobacter marinus]